MTHEQPTKIFISYRHDDTGSVAENIYHLLKNAFGNIVFKDNMRIGPGDDFNKEILTHLKDAKIVLALIGKEWFMQDEDHCVRLENEEDWVRKELEFCVTKDINLIPVLIDSAKIPTDRSFRNLPVLSKHFRLRFSGIGSGAYLPGVNKDACQISSTRLKIITESCFFSFF